MKKYLPGSILLLLTGCKPNLKNDNHIVVSQSTIAKHIECLASDEFRRTKLFTKGKAK